mgnify:FL=1
MAFDPKEFLARTTPAPATTAQSGAFDPKAFLARTGKTAVPAEQTGLIESLARGGAQGLTVGFADELSGLVESALTDKTYEQARDESRANFKAADKANPIASGIGTAVGGLGSFAVPGLGAVGTGMKGVLATGAKLGALSGVGTSEGHTAREVGADTLKGAAVGTVLAPIMSGVSGAAGLVGSKIAKTAEHAVNPAVQRLLALGAKARDLIGPRGQKALEGQSELAEMGLFARTAQGKLPDQAELAARLHAKGDEIVKGMRDLVSSASQSVNVDPQQVGVKLIDAADAVIAKAQPTAQRALNDNLSDNVLAPLMKANGDLGKLWELKKNVGEWIGPAWNKTRSPEEIDMYKAVNSILNEEVISATNAAAEKLGLPALAKLNKQYGAIANTRDMLSSSLASEAVKSSPIPGIGQFLNAGKAIANSPEARLARAEFGEQIGRGVNDSRAMLGMRAKQQADAAAMQANPQAIPRSTEGVKQWVAQNMEFIGQAAPQLSGIAKRLLGEPPGVAEQTVRSMMPILTKMMTPSAYASELDGKVMEPQDRLTVGKQLQQVPGLTPTQMAVRRSALNKTGQIPTEVYAPVTPGPKSLDDEMSDYTARLKAMGY